MQLHLRGGGLLAQSGEEAADLVAGQRDQLVLARVAAARLGRGQHGHERTGEQGQDDPAVPGGPAPDLVLVQAGEFLADGEPVLSNILKSLKVIGQQRRPG